MPHESSIRVAIASVEPVAGLALSRGEHWLTGAERARLAAISRAERRAQFLAGHWLARELAASVLDRAPDRLEFVTDDAGRPRIAADGEPVGFVSLSHSGGRLACAWSWQPIGIDLEFPQPRRDLDAVSRYTFSDAELAWLAGQGADRREAAFYRLWTLKEARGKHSGEGLLPGRARGWTAVAAEPARADAATWAVGNGVLAVATGGVAALAPEGLDAAAAPEFWAFRDGV